MEDCLIELKKIFIIAYDVYGLNPHQILLIKNSIDTIEEAVLNYNEKNEEIYVKNYNTLAQLLNNVQQIGNVFKLEDASNVYNKLKTIKTYLETKDMSSEIDEVDANVQFIKATVNACFFMKMTFNLEDTKKLVNALDQLAEISLDKNEDVNQLDNVNLVKLMVEYAQSKGKFSLEHVDGVINALTNLRKSVIQFNVDRSKNNSKKSSKPVKSDKKITFKTVAEADDDEAEAEEEAEEMAEKIAEEVVEEVAKPVKAKRKYNKKRSN
jgi:hypothetical protein